MSEPTALSYWREILLGLFPWLARIGLTSSGALGIRSATSKIEIEGGTAGVARVGDVAGYRYLQVTTSGGVVTAVVEFTSSANGTASVWTPVATGPAPPVDGVTSGTAITITTGSGKVTCG